MEEEKNKCWYLKQVNLFSNMTEEEVMAIATNAIERKCKKKEILYTPFQSSNVVYVLKKGEVTLYHSKDGKKLIIDVLEPGSFFGNIAFDQEKATHFAEVTEDAYICIFPVEDFLKVIQHNPELMLRFIRIISDKLSDYENRMKGNLMDAKERIIHYLEILEEKHKDSFLNKVARYKPKITHTKLSEHTGLTRETVTRAISELKKEGKIVEDEKHKIKLNL